MIAGRTVPEPLDLVEAFINTLDLERQSDEIATPAALKNWLRARKLIGASTSISPAELARALQLREALRSAARSNNGDRHDGRSLRELSRLARHQTLLLALGPQGETRLIPAKEGFEAALGQIMAAVAVSMLTGSWVRLKSCASDDCQWAFYDASKNRSRRWCDMADCGNEAKGRAFRSRRATRPSPRRRPAEATPRA